MCYNITNDEGRNKMYGLPDSAILGTAKRAKRGIVGSRSRRRPVESTENGLSLVIRKWITRNDRKKVARQQTERLERKHKVRFTDK